MGTQSHNIFLIDLIKGINLQLALFRAKKLNGSWRYDMKYHEGCTEEFNFQYFNIQKKKKNLPCKIYIDIMPRYVYID